MRIYRLHSHSDFIKHAKHLRTDLDKHQEFLEQISSKDGTNFTVPGYSYTAGKQVNFLVDYQHSTENRVNWRERVCCPETYFNNRMRATFHLFDIEMECYADSRIYLTERITPIYTYFKDRFPNTIGSEYLADKVKFGECDNNDVRNENLCELTFKDESFDALITLDVLEHIPDYLSAFRECARVLKKGKKMFWTVPFIPNSAKNVIRATIQNNEIHHCFPPEYHGNPLSSEGLLCFQHFGWEMLEQIVQAGFAQAYALCFYSNEFGYLGGEQFIFVAVK
jgi:hypothetical protein